MNCHLPDRLFSFFQAYFYHTSKSEKLKKKMVQELKMFLDLQILYSETGIIRKLGRASSEKVTSLTFTHKWAAHTQLTDRVSEHHNQLVLLRFLSKFCIVYRNILDILSLKMLFSPQLIPHWIEHLINSIVNFKPKNIRLSKSPGLIATISLEIFDILPTDVKIMHLWWSKNHDHKG